MKKILGYVIMTEKELKVQNAKYFEAGYRDGEFDQKMKDVKVEILGDLTEIKNKLIGAIKKKHNSKKAGKTVQQKK